MNNKSKLKKKILYGIFVILVLVVSGVFGYFSMKYSKIDKNKYEVTKDSVLYTSSSSYVVVEGEALLSQKLDGYYYLNDKYENASHITKIAKTAISNNDSEGNVNIYGVAYNIDKSGEVLIVDGKTEVSKTSPSKFYKIDDRKYLFVDSEITSDDGTIRTNGYIIIDIDKEGNASFANNTINIKTIKPIIIKGSTLEFDIANELLKNDEGVIDLKKVIGSTNKYSKDVYVSDSNGGSANGGTGEGGGGGGGGGGGSGSSVDQSGIVDSLNYYDQYFNDVINSVNNLTNSVSGVNEKTNQSVRKNEIYFDFSKWMALKSVNSTINSVSVSYQVFDPNNEYQSVFIILRASNGAERTVYLNKENTSIIIGNLDYNTMYTLEFCNQGVGDDETVITDSVVFFTKKPEVSLVIDKVSVDKVYFTLKTLNFKLDSGMIKMYENEMPVDEKYIDTEKAITAEGFSGYFYRSGISNNTEIKITDAIYDEDPINLDVSARFIN